MRLTPISLAFSLVFSAVASTSLRAQVRDASDSLARRGDHVRIRLTGTDSLVVTGRYRAMRNDSLLIAPDRDDWPDAFGADDVALLEIQRDEKTRDEATTVMAIIGGLAGGASAVAICLNNRAACAADLRAEREAECRGEDYADWGELLVGGGVLVGALLGYALAPAPHWDVVMLPTRSVGPTGQQHLGLNLGLRYSLGRRQR
jgi:hypothetical protein